LPNCGTTTDNHIRNATTIWHYALWPALLEASQEMNTSTLEPCLSASLRASSTHLDLSAARSFSLAIILTLHAPKPILLYKSNTFLFPRAALHKGGIEFIHLRQSHDGEEMQLDSIERNTIHIQYDGPARSWDSKDFLVLEPQIPLEIGVPFNSPASRKKAKEEIEGAAHFDLYLYMNTASFETGEMYKAVLPQGRKVDWWRWATAKEVEAGYRALDERGSVSETVCRWWKGEMDDKGVPALGEEEQLSIKVVGEDVVLKCVGQRADSPWPMMEE
jgi:hypothetical protein